MFEKLQARRTQRWEDGFAMEWQFTIIEVTKKGFYKLQNNSTSVLLKSAVSGSRLKAANLPDEMSENADQNSYQFEDGSDQSNLPKPNTTIKTISGNANKDSQSMQSAAVPTANQDMEQKSIPDT